VEEAILGHYAKALQAGLRGNDAWIAAAADQIDAALVTADALFAQRAEGMVEVRFIPG
jgi:predicted nucleic acid-binding protein